MQVGFDKWVRIYNHYRPHEATGMAVRADRYQASPRLFPEVIPPPDYPTRRTFAAWIATAEPTGNAVPSLPAVLHRPPVCIGEHDDGITIS